MIGSHKRICCRITEIYLMLMASAFQLFTGPEGYILLGWKKFLAFSIITGVWLITLVICVIIKPRCLAERISLYEILIIVFAIAVILSTCFSAKRGSFFSYETGRYDGLGTYLLYCVILLGVFRFGRPNERILIIFAFSYTLNCILSLLQIVGYNPFELYPWGLNYNDPYVQEYAPFLGTMGNIDVMSALHCIAVPLTGLTVLFGQRRWRFFLLIPCILGIICVVLAGVSSGILALAVETVVLIGFMPVILQSRYGCFSGKKRRTLLCAGWCPVIAICIVTLLVVRFAQMPSGPLSELQSIMKGEIKEEFGSHRIQIWRECMTLFKNNPILGTGPDTLGNLLPIRFTKISALTGEEINAYVDNAHNEYLQFLTCFGLLGFLPMFLLQISTLLGLFSKKTKRTADTLILSGTCLCYMIQAFFNIGLCITTPFICIVWALLMGSLHRGTGIPARSYPWRKALKVSFYSRAPLKSTGENWLCINGCFWQKGTEYYGTADTDKTFFIVFSEFVPGKQRAYIQTDAKTEKQFTAADEAMFCRGKKVYERRMETPAENKKQQYKPGDAVVLEFHEDSVYFSSSGSGIIYLLRDESVRQLSNTYEGDCLLISETVAGEGKNKKTDPMIPNEKALVESRSLSAITVKRKDRFLLCAGMTAGNVSDETIRHISTDEEYSLETGEMQRISDNDINEMFIIVDVN